MNPHRPRKPRPEVPALALLHEWRRCVETTEAFVRSGESLALADCPCCGRVYWTDARDRLEGMMRNGGRRARRLRVAVAELDERYREVTRESAHAWRAEPWWDRRVPRG